MDDNPWGAPSTSISPAETPLPAATAAYAPWGAGAGDGTARDADDLDVALGGSGGVTASPFDSFGAQDGPRGSLERRDEDADEEGAGADPWAGERSSNEVARADDAFVDAEASPTGAQDSFEDAQDGEAEEEDDDDFGEMGGDADGDDDFGDFGDEQDGGFDDARAAPASYQAPTMRIDDASHAAVSAQLAQVVDRWFPSAYEVLSDEREREVEGPAQVLVNERLRSLNAKLAEFPAMKPLDWRRSRIRKEYLVTLGVPINLDDSNDGKPLSSLVIPGSSRPESPHTAGLRSGSSTPHRSSTPVSGGVRSPPSMGPPPETLATRPPPLDRVRAAELVAIQVDGLADKPVEELRALRAELETLSCDASAVLTHALLSREKELGDKETYNSMIQDLVSAAAKLKTSTTSMARTGSGSGLTRGWGRRTPGPR